MITQSFKEIWDTMKRLTLRIIRIEDGEYQFNSTENISNRTIEENFLNLTK